MAQTTLHLRSETKHLERRTPRRLIASFVPPYCSSFNLITVTPTITKALIDSGYIVNVEKSTGCVFRNENSAPKDHIIVGLKELFQNDDKLILLRFIDIQVHPDDLTSPPRAWPYSIRSLLQGTGKLGQLPFSFCS